VKRALSLLLVLGCAHALPVGAPFPPLQVRTLEGAPVKLRDLRGPALVDLWATWCVPCAHALPFYQRLAKETGIEVIAISIDAEDAKVAEWLLSHPVSFRILRDPDGAVAEELGMRLMPTSFLIDARGMVRARHDGFRDEDEPAIEAEVRALFARP
jgi:cytochrome c biogenesis protein CcmG, thiol:disulfide interchange protein DsbE